MASIMDALKSPPAEALLLHLDEPRPVSGADHRFPSATTDGHSARSWRIAATISSGHEATRWMPVVWSPNG